MFSYYFWYLCRGLEVCDLWFVFYEGDSDNYCEIGCCFEDSVEGEEGCWNMVVIEEMKRS